MFAKGLRASWQNWFSWKPRKGVATKSAPPIATVSAPVPIPAAQREPPVRMEVSACLPVIDLLEKQLQDVIGQVEHSVVEVCQGFDGMAKQAQTAVMLTARGLTSNSDSLNGEDLIQATQSSLQDLLNHVREASDFSLKSAEQLREIKTLFDSVVKCLDKVDNISDTAQLVALNGRIEAARAGVIGRSFMIVAEETKSLAMHAASTSSEIRGLMNQLSESISCTSNEIQQRAAQDAEAVSRCQASVGDTLDSLRTNNQQLEASLQQASELGQKLSRDIAAAVMGLQFQDAVSQRVGHVVELLHQMRQHLESLALPATHPMVKDRAQYWLNKIHSKYTMASERRVQEGSARARVVASLPSSVELF